MINREKVISGLEHCANWSAHMDTCDECPYGGHGVYGCTQLSRDALALLKEQVIKDAPTIGGWISIKEVRQALKVLYSICYSKRQNTNPIAYVSRCDVSFVNLMDDEVTGGFGKWMYANGVNSAITGIRMYIEDMLRTLDELENEPAQEVTEG